MSTRRRQWIWMLPAVVAAIGVASPAQAQQQPTAAVATPAATAPPATAEVLAEARRAYGEGTEHFNAGRFAEALASFERAFALRANPVVLKPIAECHERLGHVPEAIAALERYLSELPTAADHAQLEARLATLRQRPARVSVSSTPDGAQIVVDGESRPQRTPADVDVPPGHHRISANLSGYRATEREVETSPGVPLSVGVTLEREGTSGVTTVPPPVTGRRVSSAVWVATAVAGAAAVAGTVFGIMALSDANDYETAPTQDLLDRGQRNALLSDVSFAASVLSAGVAVVVYFADRGRTESATTPAATSSARMQFTGTGVRVTF
jgi:tetratricopeptide (TPR) repeat protein|nr:PEGA domain-containing protein [Deltaproteobacteria bacterium]